MADGLVIIDGSFDADNLAEQALFDAGVGGGRRVGENRELWMARDATRASAANHPDFVGSGFFGIMLGGGMPMLQHPNIIGNVLQGRFDFLIANSTGRAMNREFQCVMTKPDNLPGLCVGKECATAHRRINLVRNHIKFQKTDRQGEESFLNSVGNFHCFPFIKSLFYEKHFCQELFQARQGGQRFFVGAPSEAWCFLPGESPGRVRAGHPPVSSVAPLAERDRRLMPQSM